MTRTTRTTRPTRAAEQWLLNPAQWAFVVSPSRFSFYVGGIGAGKTYAGAVRAIARALDHPGALGLIGAPTYSMLRDTTARTFFELLPRPLIAAHHKSEGRLVLRNGSEILLRSLDQPDRVRGLGLLPHPARTQSRYRLYDASDEVQLRFILKAKAIGLTLSEIRDVLTVLADGSPPCAYVLALVDEKVAEIDRRLAALAELRAQLDALRTEAARTMTTPAAVCGIIESHNTKNTREEVRQT